MIVHNGYKCINQHCIKQKLKFLIRQLPKKKKNALIKISRYFYG